MHTPIVALGIFIVIIILVHIIFRVIKFTLGIVLLGIALIAVCYIFQQRFGIDLVGELEKLF